MDTEREAGRVAKAAAGPALPRRGGSGWRRPESRVHRRLAAQRVVAFALLLSCLAAPISAQPDPQEEPLEEFRRLFEAGVGKGAEIGDPSKAKATAQAALLKLRGAEELIGKLEEKRWPQARFFVAVRQAEIYLRLSNALSANAAAPRQECARLATAARRVAIEEGSYKTYYRSLVLILLWQSLDWNQMLSLLGRAGDRDYLMAEKTLEEGRAKGYEWPLRILASDLRMTEDPDGAVEDLRRIAHEIEGQGKDLRDWRDLCFDRLAQRFIQLRDYDRARIFIAEVSPEKSRLPRTIIALQTGDYALAEKEAILLARHYPAFHLVVGDARERQGAGALDPGVARQKLKAALGAYAKALKGQQIPEERGAARRGQGDCYYGLGQLSKARQAYEQALAELDRARTKKAEAERAETLKQLGRVAEREGKDDEAFARYISALEKTEDARQDIPMDALGISWLEPSLIAAVDGVLRTCLRAQRSPAEALAAMDRMKARGVLDWLGRVPAQEDLTRYRQAVQNLSMARDAEELKQRQRELEELRSGGGAGGRGRGREVRGLGSEEVQALVQGMPGSCVLSYWCGREEFEERIYLVLAGQGTAFKILDLGTWEEGRERLREATEAVSSPGGDPWPALDRAATFFLPASLHAAIQAAGSLVFCADALLTPLPFEALRVGGEPLGILKPTLRVPSLAVLAQLQQRQARAGPALVLDSACPPAEVEQRFGLSALEFSSREGELVAESHPGSQRLSAERATFQELQQSLSEAGAAYALLHMSCHAVAHAYLPSSSLLVLSDGACDMRSLASLQLKDMLVVFSSCQSGGGEARGGEGVVGLLWGPLGAGARGVVASHWPQNQQATTDLMGQFHHFLGAGQSPETALQQARMKLAAAENYRHPYYWAGFAVYAAPTQGAGVSYSQLWWWLLGGAVGSLLLLSFLFMRTRVRCARSPSRTGAAATPNSERPESDPGRP